MSGEVKPGSSRGLRSWAQRHLNAGFAVGFLLVLLTYLVVSRQLAVTAPDGKQGNSEFSSSVPASSDRCFIRFLLSSSLRSGEPNDD